eukprot:CAMPEP_0118642390 /NCGR_PEP_ID=MMETSP0785-20121206/5809_1 /TAXON_ID=91992 /ORGANISM="Bolidomonas pacifica, Strain CCMP 1866" /LENGTH=234 /DNA_ID=CAMNT_0006533937 /DNA_START=61 /DNA_END=761 /DNA_ORIENTATION=+
MSPQTELPPTTTKSRKNQGMVLFAFMRIACTTILLSPPVLLYVCTISILLPTLVLPSATVLIRMSFTSLLAIMASLGLPHVFSHPSPPIYLRTTILLLHILPSLLLFTLHHTLMRTLYEGRLPEAMAMLQLGAGWGRDWIERERGLKLSTPNVQLLILLVTTNLSCLLQGNFNATVRCDLIIAATLVLWKSVDWEEFLKGVIKDSIRQTLSERRPTSDGTADEDDIVFLFISYL